MMIPTFIYQSNDRVDDLIRLSGPEAHHITKVLRLNRGEMVRLINGQGMAHICEISSADVKDVSCRIVKSIKNSGEPHLQLTLAIGLSTSSKFDTVLEKGTEVGVSAFIPLLTEKGKVKLGDRSAVGRKMTRWQRICEAAVKQSGRSRIPAIADPIVFDDFISTCDPARVAMFHPGDRMDDINRSIDLISNNQLTIIVGPESGFSKAELDQAADSRITHISLGSRILRTETAGTVLSALIIYLAEIVKA